MFGINWMQLLVLIGIFGVGAAVVAYLALRLFVWSKAESKSLEHIRKHALWTGIIAWAFSALTGASRAGLYSPLQSFDPTGSTTVAPVDPWSTIPVSWLVVPVVAALLAHVIGQLSWPAPKSPRRTAVLEFRRVRDYVEPALGWTVFGIFLLSVGALIWLAFAPAFPGRMSSQDSGGLFLLPLDGRIPGWMLATALGASLAILAVGTLLTMRLIASRRSLEALTAEQNATLRTIGTNRLLRVSATMASGLAAIAGNYLAQPAPDSTGTSWVNWLALVNMMVLIAMLVWKPPFLDSDTDDATYNALFNNVPSPTPESGDGIAAAKLSNTAGLTAPAAGAIGLLLGFALIPWSGWLGPLTVALAFVLLSHLGLELLLRRNYATPGTARTPLKAAVPLPLLLAFAVGTLGLIPALFAVNDINRGGLYDWPGFGGSAPHFLVPFICALLILAAGAAAIVTVLLRPGLNDASELLDRTLRRRSLFRIVRTVGSGLLAILAAVLFNLGTEPAMNINSSRSELGIVGALCIVLAAVLCFYPVRGYTPADFMPRAKSSTSLGK